jgi:O-acetylhomoserine/O-acetylserine sulfhydrylase-like pyridoxal-dependent enzyme
MKLRTRLVQRGRTARSNPGTVNIPVARASTVTFESIADMQEVQRRFDADEPIPTYGMLNMPLRVAFEEVMVQLEGGHRAVTLSSGLAANVVAILACVKAGDHILVTDSVYQPVRRFCLRQLARFGVETTFYDPSIGAGIASLMKDNTRLVYVESPGSHTFEVQDIPAIAAVAHARGAAVIHDNAWATGVFYRSFDHGADIVVQPCTKYPAGHSTSSSAPSSRTRNGGPRCATRRAITGRWRAPTTSSSRCAACARWRCGCASTRRAGSTWRAGSSAMRPSSACCIRASRAIRATPSGSATTSDAPVSSAWR